MTEARDEHIFEVRLPGDTSAELLAAHEQLVRGLGGTVSAQGDAEPVYLAVPETEAMPVFNREAVTNLSQRIFNEQQPGLIALHLLEPFRKEYYGHVRYELTRKGGEPQYVFRSSSAISIGSTGDTPEHLIAQVNERAKEKGVPFHLTISPTADTESNQVAGITHEIEATALEPQRLRNWLEGRNALYRDLRGDAGKAMHVLRRIAGFEGRYIEDGQYVRIEDLLSFAKENGFKSQTVNHVKDRIKIGQKPNLKGEDKQAVPVLATQGWSGLEADTPRVERIELDSIRVLAESGKAGSQTHQLLMSFLESRTADRRAGLPRTDIVADGSVRAAEHLMLSDLRVASMDIFDSPEYADIAQAIVDSQIDKYSFRIRTSPKGLYYALSNSRQLTQEFSDIDELTEAVITTLEDQELPFTIRNRGELGKAAYSIDGSQALIAAGSLQVSRLARFLEHYGIRSDVLNGDIGRAVAVLEACGGIALGDFVDADTDYIAVSRIRELARTNKLTSSGINSIVQKAKEGMLPQLEYRTPRQRPPVAISAQDQVTYHHWSANRRFRQLGIQSLIELQQSVHPDSRAAELIQLIRDSRSL